MLRIIINFITRSIDVNCAYCKKRINIKKKYANKYICCSDSCGHKFFTGVQNIYFEETENSSDRDSLL